MLKTRKPARYCEPVGASVATPLEAIAFLLGQGSRATCHHASVNSTGVQRSIGVRKSDHESKNMPQMIVACVASVTFDGFTSRKGQRQSVDLFLLGIVLTNLYGSKGRESCPFSAVTTPNAAVDDD